MFSPLVLVYKHHYSCKSELMREGEIGSELSLTALFLDFPEQSESK
jgi:hypothetical protein